MKIFHPFFDASGIQFDAFSFFQKKFQDGIKYVFILFRGIISVHVRTVSHHVNQVTVDIKVGKFSDIFQNGLKVFPVGFLLAAPLKESGIVGISSVADVGGTDNKIKLIRLGIYCVLTHDFRLQTKLHTKEQADFILIFIFQACQFIEI